MLGVDEAHLLLRLAAQASDDPEKRHASKRYAKAEFPEQATVHWKL